VSLFLLVPEESSGCVKVEQVELLVRWQTGGGVGAGEGERDDGVPLGVEVLCRGSSEDAGCSCEGLVLSAEEWGGPTCDNDFHDASMVNNEEKVEKSCRERWRMGYCCSIYSCYDRSGGATFTQFINICIALWTVSSSAAHQTVDSSCRASQSIFLCSVVSSCNLWSHSI
jgi:hypothetical protein